MNRWHLSPSVCLILAIAVMFTACFSDHAAPPPLPSDSNSVVRGQQIVEGFGACGFCHSMNGKPGSALSGGRKMRDLYGGVVTPNITLGGTGVGDWSEIQLRALFRSNRRPDEAMLYSPLHEGFEWMSDADLTAIIAYLRSIPPVENEDEQREVSFFDRNITGFFRSKAEVKGYVPHISQSFRVQYGEYITNNIAGCARCHSKPAGLLTSSEFLAGGQEIRIDDDAKVAPNITPSKVAGIGEWNENDLKRYLRSGRTPTGREVDKRFCPVEFYQRAPLADVDAVVAYLRTVPAID